MKTTLLKLLRKKHMIMEKTVFIFKKIYSVKPYHSYIGDNDFAPVWGSYSLIEAKKKQQELILKSLQKLKNKSKYKYYLKRGYFNEYGKKYISYWGHLKAKILGLKTYKKIR